MAECGIERGGELRGRSGSGAVRSGQTAIERGVEERGPHAIGGEGVAQSAWGAADDAVEPKSAEIVGHRTGAVAGQVATEEGSHQWTQVAVTEAIGQMAEAAQRAKQ